MSKGQFRFSYFTKNYEATVAFYRDGLEFAVIESWDRGLDDRGTLFSAASGFIEVLAFPQSGDSSDLWDARTPQGVFMVIEVDDVREEYRRAVTKGMQVTHELRDQHWGHRSFCVSEPNGLTVYFFTEIREG